MENVEKPERTERTERTEQYAAAKEVGIIGLGLVGKALAWRFLQAGYMVYGFDIKPEASEEAVAIGVIPSESLERIAEKCRVILLCVLNSDDVNSVFWKKNGLGDTCRENSLIIDTTTTDPQETARHAAIFREKGVRLVDSPLMGNSQEILDGKGVALLGDTPQGAANYVSIIETVVPRIYYFGGVSKGHTAKLAINLMLGLHRVVLGEGLGFAKQAGLDTKTVLEAAKVSAAGSEVMYCQGDRIINRLHENPTARLDQHWKDVRLILKEAERIGARVPLSWLHDSLMAEAEHYGLGQLENSAIAELFLNPGNNEGD